jgi:hypothetical protein
MNRAITAMLVLGVFVLGFVTTVMPIVGWDLSKLPGDLVDSRFNNYILEHGHRYLHGQEKRFWDARFCYPARCMIASSDSHLANLPIYTCLRRLGTDQERAYQLWWLSTFPLTYLSTFLALRWAKYSVLGASVAATMFTFSLPVMGCSGHAQLFPRYTLAWAVLAWWKFLQAPNRCEFAIAVFATAWQIILTVYIGYFLLWMLLALTLTMAIFRQIPWGQFRALPRRSWLEFVAVMVLALLQLAPFFHAYFSPNRVVGRPAIETVIWSIPTLSDWSRPTGTSEPWAFLFALAVNSDDFQYCLFPGAVALVSFAYGFTRRHTRPFACAVLALFLFFLKIETDLGLFSPYSELLSIQVFTNIRGVFRVAIVLSFPLALLGAWLLEALHRRLNPRWRWVAAVGVFVVILVDQASMQNPPGGYTIREAQERRLRLTRLLEEHPNAKIVHLFTPTEDFMELLSMQMDIMLAAQATNRFTTNGWTGHYPVDWFPFQTHSDLFHWFQTHNLLSPQILEQTLLLGSPKPPTTPLEAELQKLHPPIPWK